MLRKPTHNTKDCIEFKTEFKKEGKTSVVLKNDSSNDITGTTKILISMRT
jgi:hypothetical protein